MSPRKAPYRMVRRSDRILQWAAKSIAGRQLNDEAIDELTRRAPLEIGMHVAREQIRTAAQAIQLRAAKAALRGAR